MDRYKYDVTLDMTLTVELKGNDTPSDDEIINAYKDKLVKLIQKGGILNASFSIEDSDSDLF